MRLLGGGGVQSYAYTAFNRWMTFMACFPEQADVIVTDLLRKYQRAGNKDGVWSLSHSFAEAKDKIATTDPKPQVWMAPPSLWDTREPTQVLSAAKPTSGVVPTISLSSSRPQGQPPSERAASASMERRPSHRVVQPLPQIGEMGVTRRESQTSVNAPRTRFQSSQAGSFRSSIGSQRGFRPAAPTAGSNRYFSQSTSAKPTPQFAKNNMISSSVFAGERRVMLELRRNFNSISNRTFQGKTVFYRLIRASANYGLGYFERTLNPSLINARMEIPMLMQFGRGDASGDTRYTVGEVQSVTQYATFNDNRGRQLPFQSNTMPLESFVNSDGVLISNQIATSANMSKASDHKVSASMCIVEGSRIIKSGSMTEWTTFVHTIEEFGAVEIINQYIAYSMREPPKRGDLVCLDGFRVNAKHPLYSGYGCHFVKAEIGTERAEDGFYPTRLCLNQYLNTTTGMQVGWVNQDPGNFSHVSRIATELAAAVLSFDKQRGDETLELQKVKIKNITYESDFVYRIEVDMSSIGNNRERKLAICQMAGNCIVYEMGSHLNRELEVKILEGSIENTTFKGGLVESFEVRHFIDPDNLPELDLDLPPEEDESKLQKKKKNEDIELVSLEDAIKMVTKDISTIWSEKFIESLRGKSLWIRCKSVDVVYRKAHNMIRLLKQPWDSETRHGRILSILNGAGMKPDRGINWDQEKKKAKNNDEQVRVNAQQARRAAMQRHVLAEKTLDAEQRQAITSFLTIGRSVTVMEAFGGSGKTYTIGNAAFVFEQLDLPESKLLIISKTNESVRVLARELGRSDMINPDKVLLVQSARAAQIRLSGKGHQFTMEYKAEQLVSKDAREMFLSNDERNKLVKFLAIAERGIQLTRDLAVVRRVITTHMPPSVILMTTDMTFMVTGLITKVTHLVVDEGSNLEDAKLRALTVTLKNLQYLLVSGDPGQLEPFTHIRMHEETDLIRFGMNSAIEQLVLRGTAEIITLLHNRRSIPALLSPIISTSSRYGNMIGARFDPNWDTDPYQNFPPAPRYKSPYTLVDITGMHETVATGSLHNRFQEDFVTRYLKVIARLEAIGAISKKRTVQVLSFYAGADMITKELTAGLLRGRLECNTVDTSMGKEADTVITSTSRAEKPGGLKTRTIEDNLFINKDGRVRVCAGRPQDRAVFVGRMDVCTSQPGAMRNFLRVAAQSTPVMKGEVFIEMLEEWVAALETKIGEGVPLHDIEFYKVARHGQSQVLYRDMIYASGARQSDFSHISNCRLNKEFEWDNAATHLAEAQLPSGYVYAEQTVDYDAPPAELIEEKEKLKQILENEGKLARAIIAEAAVNEEEAAIQPGQQSSNEDVTMDVTTNEDPFAGIRFIAPRKEAGDEEETTPTVTIEEGVTPTATGDDQAMDTEGGGEQPTTQTEEKKDEGEPMDEGEKSAKDDEEED